jgi:hypothetical protein
MSNPVDMMRLLRRLQHLVVCLALCTLMTACSTSRSVEPLACPAVALIEWQFPVDQPPGLPIHPLQRNWLSHPEAVDFSPALYPNLSEESKKETPYGLARLTKHGERCARTYAAGRANFTPPFLLNVSTTTPNAVQALIKAGVRIFCFSIGGRGEDARLLEWVPATVRDNPDVLFVVSTPHISGNSISVEKLNETPSVLAGKGHKNILLVGALRFYEEDIKAQRAGRKLGSVDNPFFVDSQPANKNVPQVFMMNDKSTREFVEGFSGTSAAAPHLASLLGLIAEDLVRKGSKTPLSSAALLAELNRVTHHAAATEKSHEIHDVSYFTLDTILFNAGRPLISKAIWGEFVKESPAPLSISR